ncbi:MAG: hypothetical protein EOP54_12055 [Sphingobacteriales bacterium]|nr:MAG: hypothetical protein EOP54_12055 [Sphingobacteriales bacterium]
MTLTAIIGETLPVKQQETVMLNLAMKAIPNAVIKVITDQANIASENADKDNYSWKLSSSAKYVRIEVRNARGAMLALTNPIWFK